jgi:hypothetical protein
MKIVVVVVVLVAFIGRVDALEARVATALATP